MENGWTPPADAAPVQKSTWTPPADAAPVKKKENSVSPSNGVKPTTSSATKGKETQQLSGSSASKENTNIYTGFPGKEQKKYRFDDSSGRPTWYEYSATVVKNGKQQEIYDKPIHQPERIDALNKHFKKNIQEEKPSGAKAKYADVTEGVYTGFPGKEQNEYRVIGNNWQRKEPNKDWVTVKDSNAIIGLNKQFKKKITPNEEFEGISSKLIANSEETVVPYLQRNYGNLGFVFEESKAGSDRVTVRTEDGTNSETFFLDNFTTSGDSEEAIRLKAWLKQNVKTIDSERYAALDQEIRDIKNVKPSEKTDFTNDAFEGQKAGIPADLSLDIKQQLQLKEKEKEAIDYNKGRMNSLLSELSKAKALEGSDDDKLARAKVAAVYGNKDELARQNRYINNELTDIARVNTDLKRRKEELARDIDAFNTEVESAGGVFTEDLEAKKSELEGRSELIDKTYSDLETNISASKRNNYKLEIMSAEYMLQKESQGSTGGGIVNSFLKGATTIGRLAGMSKDDQRQLIESIGSAYTTEEFTKSKDRSSIEKVLFSLSESIGAAAVGGVAGKVGSSASFFSQSYYEVKDEMNSNPDFASVPEQEKDLLAVVYGVSMGFLEKFGVDTILSKTPISKTLVNKILTSSIKGLPKGAPIELVEEAVNNNMKALIAKGAIQVVGSSLVEGSTEFAQELTGGGIKELYNEIKDKELFDTPDDILGQGFEAAWMGALGGAIMQTPIQAVSAISTGLSKKNSTMIDILEKSVSDSEVRSMIVSNIKTQIVNNQITKEEGQEQIRAINDAASVFSKIPDNVSDISRAKSFDLLIERSKIEKEIEGKDPALVDIQKARITEINEELKTISNATKEDKQPVKEDTTKGSVSEYKGTDEGQQKVGTTEGGIGKAEKSEADRGDSFVANKEQIRDNSAPEVDRLKSVAADVEDGVTLNLDGTKYEEGGLVVPVASKNVTAEELTPEMISDFIEENVGKIGDTNSVKVGLYKFPNSNQVSIDLNVIAPESSREAAVEFGKLADQESLFDLSTFENVKTGGTGMNPAQFTDEQFKEISKALSEGRVPDVFTDQVTNENSADVVNRIAKETGDDRQIAVAKATRSVLKALPGVKVFLHKDTSAYRKALADKEGKTKDQLDVEESDGASSGSYIDGEIHIDLSVANNATLYHEAFHHVFAQKGISSGAAKEMATGLKKVVSDKALIAQIEEFEKKYDTDEQAEEFLSELAAVISANEQILTPTNVEKIKQIVNSIAKKMGLPAMFSAADGRKEVLDFMNTVSKSIRTGVEISRGESKINSRKKRMTEPVAGNKLFNEPLEDASKIAVDYSKKSGIEFIDPERVTKLDESNSKAIASEYDKMKNDPTNPEVKAAYEAMINETISQYDEIISNGYVVEINNEEPYSSSGDMISDLRDNKRMKIFSTESGFGDEPITDEQRNENPLLAKTKYVDVNGIPLLANDLFRFVHDFFGHAKFGNGFGPVGEENAWRIHSAMYSDPARRAMTSETRGQNSWVNFSGVNSEAFKLRDKARELRKQGKTEEANDLTGQVYDMMQFADQKVGLMPEWVSETGARKKRKTDDKNLGKKVDKSFRRPVEKKTVNEYTALKDQLKLEAKAARKADMNIKQKQRTLAEVVKDMARSGKITSQQAVILIKRIAYLNMDNNTMVSKFIDYAGKVFERADYQARISEANSLRKNIKSKLKKDRQAETVAMAKDFTGIDPSTIEDIDQYIEMAEVVLEAMKGSTTRGIDVIIKEAANIKEVSDYTQGALLEQENYLKEEIKAMYKDLVADGIINDDMSLSEMKELIDGLNEDLNKMLKSEQEKYIKDYIQGVIDTYASMVNHMVDTDTDPFTGEQLGLTVDQKSIAKRMIKVDLSQIDVKTALKIVDALSNFVTNKVTSSVESIMAEHDGVVNAKKIADTGFKSKSLGFLGGKVNVTDKVSIGRFWSQQFATIKTLSDTLFGGVNAASRVLRDMGFSAFEAGVAKATKMWNNITDEYSAEFKNAKPNGEVFNSANNIYERGMYAFLSRTVQGDPKQQQAELERRIGLIKQSIDVITEEAPASDKHIADVYQQIFERLGLDQEGVTITDIESRVDPINRKAVQWWVDQWSNHYSDLSDVSLSVYNTQLGKDMNYTPDKFSKVRTAKDDEDMILEKVGGAFAGSLDYVYDKKTGVLMESTRTTRMAPGRFINLDFDTNNASALKSALMDINTAASTRQIAGFLSSDGIKKIIPNAEDRDIFSSRIRSYVVRSRNKMPIANDQISAVERFSRLYATLGTAKALGGVTQAVKQTVPVMLNTIVNAGKHFNPGIMANPDARAFINRSGRAIASRGIESQSNIETVNKVMDKVANSKLPTAIDALEKVNTFWLKTFLAKPDVWIARSAWIAYYKQDLASQGLPTDIDFATAEINDQAADYAQHMVDRQQNISDTNLAGEFMAAEDPWKKITRNILMPFISFSLNQKSRMYSDVMAITSSTTSKEDRVIALRSLSGLSVEMLTYNAMGAVIKYYMITALADLVMGDDDEMSEEEKEKEIKKAKQNLASQVIRDVLSPVPATDEFIVGVADKIAEWGGSPDKSTVDKAVANKNESLLLKGKEPMDAKAEASFRDTFLEENRFKLSTYESDNNYGSFGIVYGKYEELEKLAKAAYSGEVEVEFNKKPSTKYLSEEDRKPAQTMVPLMTAYMLGLLPAETSAVTRMVMKKTTKKAMTENQYEKMNAVKKDLGKKDLSIHELYLIKSNRKIDGVKEEIEWIDRFGGLDTKEKQQKYVDLIEKQGEVSYPELKNIQEGK